VERNHAGFSQKEKNKDCLVFRIAARNTAWNQVVKCGRNMGLGNGNAISKCDLNELVFTRGKSTVLDGTTMLPDDVVDGGEETKLMRGQVMSVKSPKG
jgi:hypothetical protein